MIWYKYGTGIGQGLCRRRRWWIATVLLFVTISASSIRVDDTWADECGKHISATVESDVNAPRSYHVPMCNASFTIPELFADFSAHQVEWSVMGKTQAFYSVLTGLPRDDSLVTRNMTTDFYVSGKLDIATALSEVQSVYPDWAPRGNALDFGCGLGRLGVALAQTPGFASVTCVDQSIFHMSKLESFTAEFEKVAHFLPIVSGPDMLMALWSDPAIPMCYDFVNSLIVLQHMICPLQAVYLEQLCDVLKPNGVARLHIPSQTPMKPACTEELRKHYRDTGGMQMHYLNEGSVRQILSRRGCDSKVAHVGEKYVGANHQSMIVYLRKRTLLRDGLRACTCA